MSNTSVDHTSGIRAGRWRRTVGYNRVGLRSAVVLCGVTVSEGSGTGLVEVEVTVVLYRSWTEGRGETEGFSNAPEGGV